MHIQHDPNSLAHYGVMGMKWGVRKDGKPQGYQGPKTKKQAKKLIKKTAKAYRKANNTNEPTLGSNVVAVDRLQLKEQKANLTNQKLSAKHNELAAKERELNSQLVKARSDADKATAARVAAEADYDSALERANGSYTSEVINKRQTLAKAKQAEKIAQKTKDHYKDAWNDNHEDKRDTLYALWDNQEKVARSYRDRYLDAAVKDLGYDDVAAGRKMLSDFGLENYALNPSFMPMSYRQKTH